MQSSQYQLALTNIVRTHFTNIHIIKHECLSMTINKSKWIPAGWKTQFQMPIVQNCSNFLHFRSKVYSNFLKHFSNYILEIGHHLFEQYFGIHNSSFVETICRNPTFTASPNITQFPIYIQQFPVQD